MNELEVVGLLVGGVIVLGSFIAVILKFTQPINELRVVIQKLLDKLESLTSDNAEHGKRLDEHDNDINKLNGRVGTLETKMDMYHNKTN